MSEQIEAGASEAFDIEGKCNHAIEIIVHKKVREGILISAMLEL